MSAPAVEWVFDVISPFAYLALPQLARLPEERLRVVPVLLAGLLKHFGQLGPAEIPAKRRFTYRFALWRARRLKLPMRFPPAHPFNPLPGLRLIIAAGSTRTAAERVLRAVFAEGRDLTDPATLAALAGELGVGDAQRALSDPHVKQQLHDNTHWAIEQGIFGVPTVRIGTELFWGEDAMPMALEYLADPEGFEDPALRALEALPVGAARARTAS